MARFSIAYLKTMAHEGGYVNDKVDVGGETYAGISRVYNKIWSGWKLIDSLKKDSKFPANLKGNEQLQREVAVFYKQHYWDVNRLDDFQSQAIANEMFDTGVNMGVRRAASFLQEGMNYLNRNEQLYKNLVVDGFIGPITIKTMNYILTQRGDEEVLLKIMNVLQGMHYLNFIKQSPTQERFARGWFSRVSL
jgi:lysozyme family protein